MNTEISPKEFGKMQSDIEHIKESVDKLTASVESFNGVGRTEFEKRVEYTDRRLLGHDEQIQLLTSDVAGIKGMITLRDNSVTGKLAVFLDSMIVKVIGAGAITLLILGTYWAYQKQIDSLSEKIEKNPVVINEKEN